MGIKLAHAGKIIAKWIWCR